MEPIFQFLQRVQKFITENHLLAAGENILVAVSGGAYSVVLFTCLQQLSAKMQFNPAIAHFNHNLRGEESDGDEEFVAKFANDAGVPFFAGRGDVEAHAQKQKMSIEDAARELRYQFLENICQAHHFDRVATGHNADDQAETVLLNLIRGAGWKGLGGIPVQRGNVIRPLLFAYRIEIETVAKVAGLQFRTDRSNFSLEYRRNSIRHRLIPLIKKEHNPNIIASLVHFSQIFREGEEYFREQAKIMFDRCLKVKDADKIILEIECFSGYFTILRKYVLFYMFDLVGLPAGSVSFSRISEMLSLIDRGRTGGFVTVAGEWRLGVDHAGIVFFRRKRWEPVDLPLKPGRSLVIPPRKIKLTTVVLNPDAVVFSGEKTVEYCDADKIGTSIFRVRSIKPGDWFVPLGVNFRQKVSDFFIDHKIPEHIRPQMLVLTNGENIIWLIGYRLDQRFKITDETKKVIKFEISDELSE
ncbi:MAG TPA: tRNA lysidine(34) synthetase TilS [Bacteroidetes bacterium]|nr:tRNA lysidine(34) synthetase TilS [Bacteroidota bacterium]